MKLIKNQNIKLLSIIFVLVSFSFMFTGCGDDKKNEEPSNPLMDAWVWSNGDAYAHLIEEEIVEILTENDQLTPENVEILTRIKNLVSSITFVIQFNEDGTARMYGYRNGVAPFVTGTWSIIPNGVLLKVGTLQLPVNILKLEDNTLECMVGEFPLAFKRYSSLK